MSENKTKDWFVYIIEADDGSYYTGISTDVERRFDEHNGKLCGAKYFNGRRPVAVVHKEAGFNRSSASRREAEIKKMNRQQKLTLIKA
ncbi:MAG: GIY-YIG nuclease family protein [Gammaproteobacteria bacterium]|nr:GIY-YIG nuclease family protein [Gammaproteobacteria bacterium]